MGENENAYGLQNAINRIIQFSLPHFFGRYNRKRENEPFLHCLFFTPVFILTTLIISKKPGNTGISRDIRTEFTTDLLLSD